MSRRTGGFAGDQPSKGRLSYCLDCKDMTETVLVRREGFLGGWPFNASDRVCRTCAKPKLWSELEQ